MQEQSYIPTVNADRGNGMKTGDETQIGMVLLLGCRCRCGHEWLPREKGEKPRVCPKCKSPNWDRPKRTGSVIPTTGEGKGRSWQDSRGQ